MPPDIRINVILFLVLYGWYYSLVFFFNEEIIYQLLPISWGIWYQKILLSCVHEEEIQNFADVLTMRFARHEYVDISLYNYNFQPLLPSNYMIPGNSVIMRAWRRTTRQSWVAPIKLSNACMKKISIILLNRCLTVSKYMRIGKQANLNPFYIQLIAKHLSATWWRHSLK